MLGFLSGPVIQNQWKETKLCGKKKFPLRSLSGEQDGGGKHLENEAFWNVREPPPPRWNLDFGDLNPRWTPVVLKYCHWKRSI